MDDMEALVSHSEDWYHFAFKPNPIDRNGATPAGT